MKNKGLIIIAILLLLAWKRKKNNIVVEPVQPAPNTSADYLVEIKKNAKLYDLNKQNVIYFADQILKVDGYKTNELPTWLKIKFADNFFYVKSGDFTIL